MDDKVAGLDTQLIDLTDETLMSTPVPQATSTAQRNIANSVEVVASGDDEMRARVESRVDSKLRGAVDDLRVLQEQLKAFSSGHSTASSCSSSLELLPPETLSDFSAASTGTASMGHREKDVDDDLALDLSLRMQRALALRSFQRSAALHSGQQFAELCAPANLDSSTSSSALSEIAAHIQSDWMKTASIQGNGEQRAVSAEQSVLTPAQGAHLHKAFRMASSTEMVDMMEDLLEKYGDEEFLSQEAGEELLANDEEQFRQEVPPIHEVPDETVNLSMDFSAVREGSHITIGSSTLEVSSSEDLNRKLSIGQFFSLRTEKIKDPGFQPLEHSQESPRKFDTFSRLTAGLDASNTDASLNSPSSSAASSSMSVSKVQEMLCQFGDSMSGTAIVDKMMKGLGKKRRDVDSKVLKDTSNVGNTTAGASKLASSRRTLLMSKKGSVTSENSANVDDENVEIIYQRIRNSQRKGEHKKREGQAKSKAGTCGNIDNFVALKKGSKLSDLEDSVVCLSENLPLSKPPRVHEDSQPASVECRRKRDVARWVAQTNEQTDSSFEVRSRLNATAVIEEPVDSCFQANASEGSWVSILPSSTTEFVLAVGVLSPVLLTLKASEGRRLICHVSYKGADQLGDVAGSAMVDVEFPDTRMTIVPGAEETLQAWVRPQEAVRWRINTDIILKDVSTNETRIVHYSFLICGEEPKVLLFLDENSEPGKLDFGLLPQNCCASRNISLENKSDAYLALSLRLEQEEINHDGKSYRAFSLLEHGNSESCSELQVFLREKSDHLHCEQATVQFHPPPISSGDSYCVVHHAKLVVGFDIPNSGVVLKRLSVTGRSFHARLSARQKPVTLGTQQGCSVQKTVDLVRNLGSEGVQLKFWLEDTFEGTLQVWPESVDLEPSGAAQVALLFNPAVGGASDVTGSLMWQVVPRGKAHSLPVKCCVQTADPEEVPPGAVVSSSRTSSRSSNSCESSRASGGSDDSPSHSPTSVSSRKHLVPPLKVEATHTILSCESLAVGRVLKLSTTIRNYATHGYKLRLSISSHGGDFKMINDSGELVVSRVLKLHAMECKQLKFQFKATQLGAAVGTVTFHQMAPVNSATNRMIVLYGYGGSAKMVLRNMSRDANNKMWFSMGEVTSPGQVLVRDIVVENRGNVPGFISVFSLFEGARMLYDSTALSLSPAAVVVQPKQSQTVRVTYRLGRDHYLALAKNRNAVSEIATICMILGEESTRQRLRRLMRLDEDTPIPDTGIMSKVCSTFEKESPIADIACLKDNKETHKRFCQTFTAHMATVIVESCKDNTLASRLGEDTLADAERSDTTKTFASLLQDTVIPVPRVESRGSSVGGWWDIQPREVSLRVPQACSAVLTVWNRHTTCLLFEATATEDWLEVEPREGSLPPQSSALLRLSVPRWPAHADTHNALHSALMVYIENDCILVKVAARWSEPRPQAVSTPVQGRSRPPCSHNAPSALRLDRRELALPPTAIGQVSSAVIGCWNSSDTNLQVMVSVSKPFFAPNTRMVVVPESFHALLLHFSPTTPGLTEGQALFSFAQEKHVVRLFGKGTT